MYPVRTGLGLQKCRSTSGTSSQPHSSALYHIPYEQGIICTGSTTRISIGLVLKENGFVCHAYSHSFLVLCLLLMYFYQSLCPQCHPLFPMPKHILSLFSVLLFLFLWTGSTRQGFASQLSLFLFCRYLYWDTCSLWCVSTSKIQWTDPTMQLIQ